MMPTVFTRPVFAFDRLYDLRRELDRVFEGQTNGTNHWLPPMDVLENADAIECRLELPGLSAADVDIHVENNVLTISGEKKQVVEGNGEAEYRHVERRYGAFQRSFTLPNTVNSEAVTAHFDNGLLTLTLPKAERVKARKISVQAAGK